MPRRSNTPARANSRLSRESIVTAAVELADREGLDGFSMRKLAQALGVDAMSIYYHVHDKDTLLAAMADLVAAQITPGATTGPWTGQLRELIMGARTVMLRHPWSAAVFEGNPTPAVLLHIERVLAIMRAGGCSVDLGHHAIHLLGSRILGFSQDLFEDKPRAEPTAGPGAGPGAFDALPHVRELAEAASHSGALGGCDDDAEFAFGLDLILDGLERERRRLA